MQGVKAKGDDSGHDSGQSSMNTGQMSSTRIGICLNTCKILSLIFGIFKPFFFQAVNPFLRVLVDEKNEEEKEEEEEGGEKKRKEEKKYRCSENVSAADENKGCNSDFAHC